MCAYSVGGSDLRARLVEQRCVERGHAPRDVQVGPAHHTERRKPARERTRIRRRARRPFASHGHAGEAPAPAAARQAHRILTTRSYGLPRARSRERRERSRSTSSRRLRRGTSSPSRATIESMSPASVSGRVDAIVPFAPISRDDARESDLATTTTDVMDAETMETSDGRRSRSNAGARGRGVMMGRDGEEARDGARRTPRNASRRKRGRPRASAPEEGSLFWVVEVRVCSCESARACSGWRR